MLTALAAPAIAARDTSRACPDGDVPPSGYSDISSNVHRAAIDCLSWWGIDIYGGTGNYRPGTAITRGEQAALLSYLLDASGLQDRGSTADQGFKDIRGHTYEAQINRLVSLDVIAGKTPDTFDPDGTITRAQMASLIVQLHEKVYGRTIQPGDGFDDVPASNPHEPNVRRLVAAGITDGTSETTYTPAGRVTRAQIASFTMRHTALLVELDEATLPGDFAPIRLSGSGDDIASIDIPQGALAIVRGTHSGQGNFVVWGTDAGGESTELVANTIGNYSGTRPLGLGYSERSTGLDIQADGAWTLDILPIREATDLLATGIESSGDDVLDGYRMAGQIVTLTHDGESNFVIWAYDDSGTMLDLVANDIGSYDGTRRLPAGTRWLEVQADGNWTITPSG